MYNIVVTKKIPNRKEPSSIYWAEKMGTGSGIAFWDDFCQRDWDNIIE